MNPIERLEYFLDKLEPEQAERWIIAKLSQIQLRKRLENERVADSFDVSFKIAEAKIAREKMSKDEERLLPKLPYLDYSEKYNRDE